MKKKLIIHLSIFLILQNTCLDQCAVYAIDAAHMLTPPVFADIAGLLEKDAGYKKLKKFYHAFLRRNAPGLNKEKYIEAIVQTLVNGPITRYIDEQRLVVDMVYAVCETARESESLNMKVLKEIISGSFVELKKEGLFNEPVYPESTIENPRESISMPRVMVSQTEEEFVFGHAYTAMIEKWASSDHELHYISVNGRLLKEPVGFPGFWLLRDETLEKLPSLKRIRIMKSFALMLNIVDAIEDNRFELIVQDAEGKTDDSERVVARIDDMVMTMGEDNVIKFYVAEAFSALSCIAQRRVCFEFFNSIKNMKACLRQNKSVKKKEVKKGLKASLKKKKVVFLHMVNKDDSFLAFDIPSSYHLLAAELTKAGIDVEFQPILEGAVPIKGIGSVVSPSLRLLTERDDIGLFVVLNAAETDFYDYRRMINRLYKDSPAPIIAGGPFFTLSPEHAYTHLPHVTASIRGEGEEVIVPLAEALLGKDRDTVMQSEEIGSLLQMNNLMLNTADATVCNNIQDRGMISSHDMDQLAVVKTDFSYLTQVDLRRFFQFCSGRGCPKKCPWCSRMHGSFYRAMSAESFISMLTHYRERLDQINAGLPPGEKLPEELYIMNFADDDLFLNKKRAKKILQEFHTTGLKIESIQTSIGSLLKHKKGKGREKEPDYDLLDLLKEKRDIFSLGYPALVIGTDSFIQKEIDRHKKGAFQTGGESGYTEEDIARVVEACEERGIRNDHYLILTNVDTSWEDFFNQLYRIAEIGEGKKYFQIFSRYINKFVVSHYPSDSYKDLAERDLVRRVLTEVEPADPYYDELSYPIALQDEPLLLGPADMVYALLQRFDAAYAEVEQKLRRFDEFPKDCMMHIMYETVCDLSDLLSTQMNMSQEFIRTPEMQEAHRQVLSAESRLAELLGPERMRRVDAASPAPGISGYPTRATGTSE